MKKILFIDRDGTLIREPEDFQIDRLEKFRLVPEVMPALLRLRAAGYELVMVSNQDGLGTASYPQADFQLVQDFLLDLFGSQGITFDEVLICPHFEADGCLCRKPQVGLLTPYLQRADIDWEKSAVIGDRATDRALAEVLGIKGFQLGAAVSWTTIVEALLNAPRIARVRRKTTETSIEVSVNLDGQGQVQSSTGIGFFDHMLDQLGRHSGIDLEIQVAGDLGIDDHHTVEDTALALGEAMRRAMSDKVGIGRYGFSLPMDECRSETLIDLSGRTFTKVNLPFTSDRVGELNTEMIPHFFESLAQAMQANVHITTTGDNNHHLAEASFKSFARALGQAVARSGRGLPSTKGAL